jgi:hypothetical protein
MREIPYAGWRDKHPGGLKEVQLWAIFAPKDGAD